MPLTPIPEGSCFSRLQRGASLCLFITSAVIASAQTTLLSENFTGATVNGKIVNGTVNTWHSTIDAAISSVSIVSDSTTGPNEGSNDNAMQVVPSSASGFISTFAPTTLAVGQTLTISVDFRFTTTPGASASGVRFGLYNSNGTAYPTPAADTYDNDDPGYRVNVPTQTSTTLAIGHEAGNNGSAGGGSGTETTILSGALNNFNQQTTSTSYSFSITRVSTTQLSFGLKVNGSDALNGTSVIESSGALFAFDEAVIAAGVSSSYAFDNVAVVLTSSIPEPSTHALLFSGLAGAAVIGFRRQRR